MNEQRDKLREMLQAADIVPPAPDCRDAVMAGIGERITGFRWAWAYACAVLLLAIGVGTALLLTPSGKPHRTNVVKKAAPTQRVAPPREQAAQKPPSLGGDFRIPPEKLMQRNSEIPERAPRWRFGNRHPEKKPSNVLPKPTPVVPEQDVPEVVAQTPEAVDPDKKPVALVLVTFPSGETQTDASYEYTDRNAETGEVTKCSVTRTGDLIDIHLETTKGDEEAPPVKGCVDHENTNNA